MSDSSPGLRRCAAEALGKIGPQAAASTGALVRALDDEDAYVRGRAAEALGGIGPAAKVAVPRLLRMLQDEAPERIWAAEALGGIGPVTDEVVPALIAVVEKGENWGLVQKAAFALGQIGPDANASIPVLVQYFKRYQRVPYCAKEALGGIGEAAIKPLLKIMPSLDEDAQGEVVETLGRIGSGAIPALRELLDDANPSIGRRAYDALREIERRADDP
jgi:HEAT repeat protein